MSKLCVKCQERPARISGKRNQSYCSECNRAYGKENYHLNKDRYFKQAKIRDNQIDDLINTYKNKPCADCGISYPHYIMDLDHRDPSKKSANLAYIRRHRWAIDKIQEELLKCDPVCANCHRERTNKQSPSRYSKRQNAPGAT